MEEKVEEIVLPKKEGKKKRDKKGAKEKRDKVDPDKRLYLRFPHKIPEYTLIKEMHPLIKNVVLPRQKTGRFCFLEFDSESDALTAMKELKEFKTGNGKKLFLSLGRKAEELDSGKQKFHIQRTGQKNLSI